VNGVLVTGGAGFIGSHLVDLLLEAGEAVRVLDNLDGLAHPAGPPDHLAPEAELLVGDLRDREIVDRALRGVDRVFHLGGVVGNGESMVNVRRAVDHNAGGTATLLEAVIERRDRIQRVVAASSMVVYGEGSYRCARHGLVHPSLREPHQLRAKQWEAHCPTCGADTTPVATSEDAPLRPTSVYGITKRDQEELVLVLGRAYGIETVALRYLNVYGPRQALSNPYTGVAAIFAARLLAGRRPLLFEDGGQLRDLVHVNDVARATAAAMSAPQAAGATINVATGDQITIRRLAERIGAALGSKLAPEVTGDYRAGDIRHCFADVTKARRLLGFEARVNLEQGLPGLAEWVAAQKPNERVDDALADLRARGLVS
jgi:dTDP-L-rhamnose 4-epimerase